MLSRRRPGQSAGFTLVELMTTLALLATLLLLGMYPMREWLDNGRVRATADSVQNGLRQAQAEAIRRSRTVVFLLTDSNDFGSAEHTLTEAADAVAVATEAAGNDRVIGRHWGLFTIQRSNSEPVLIEGGLQPTNSAVEIVGPAAICFNSFGRLVERNSTQVGVGDAACDASGIPAEYIVRQGSASRALHLQVSVGGQVRMCDPARPTGALDACS